VVPPKFPASIRTGCVAGHFVLTNISLPCNAGIAVRTTCGAGNHPALRVHPYNSRGNFDWFLTNVAHSTRSGHISLAAFTSLLSSVTAFIYWGRLLRCIICEMEDMSRAYAAPNSV
jgi:hypothetical protein